VDERTEKNNNAASSAPRPRNRSGALAAPAQRRDDARADAQPSEKQSPATDPQKQARSSPDRGKPEDGKGAAQALPSVTLPRGGGAIRDIGEKFAVNAVTGTGTLDLPLPFSKARVGLQLKLAYGSGSGNGPFGFGWSIGLPEIRRKTDKGLPLFCDGDESDVFIFAGQDDLVPILDASGGRQTTSRTVHGVQFRVWFYRPRIEGLFSRIERWEASATGVSHWRTISRDNITTVYGLDATSCIADPIDATQIFSWCISRSWDTKGNLTLYSYLAEDSAGIDTSSAHEANRTKTTRGVQIYLDTIRYGNQQPYFPDWSADGDATALPTDWAFTVVLDYGNHASTPPTPTPDQAWALRPDPFSNYRAGFEVRTYRRVQRILFFNNFPAESTAGANCLVRSLDLLYSDQQTPTDPRNPIYTFLVSATLTGYRQDATLGLVARSMPAVEFTYSQPEIQPDVLTLDPDSLENLPEGFDGSRFQWVDLDGEGLSGILNDTGSSWLYKRNLSANNLETQPDGTLAARARFGPLESVVALPASTQISPSQRLLDLAGAGQLDVVALSGPDPGFYKRTQDEDFEPFHAFSSLPQIDWDDPNVKLIDVTGDGLADVLITEDGLFTFHTSLGEEGFDVAKQVRTPWDEEKGPKVVLSDGTDTIFIADMTGDGLNDIVRVRNGETCYWPNIGYGRFGAKVTMDSAPRFDNEERFDPHRIRLADIDGTGSADLLYIGEDGVRAWYNQSGNSWSAANTIGVFPSADRLSTVQVIDLLGTGTACLVWSSPLPAECPAPLRYVDLMGGQKPHLLVGVKNNLGAETRVTYVPSTRFYLDDAIAGQPWATRLPFPVHVVERVEVFDWIGLNRLVTRYAYHHGYFDGYEREFRGFGMVEQWDTEEYRADSAFNDGDFVNWDSQSWSPASLTRTWYHTGVFLEAQTVSQQYLSEYWIEPALRAPGRAADAAAMRPPDTVIPDGLNAFEVQEAYRALKGQALRIEVYAEDGSPNADNPYTVTEQNFTIVCLQNMGANLHAVFLVHPRESIAFHYERGADDPRVGHEFTLETDVYGNPTRTVSVGYPRRAGYAPPEPTLSATFQSMLAYDQTRLHIVATEHIYTNAIDDLATWPDSCRAPLPSASDVAEITGVAPSPKGTGITSLFTFDELDGTGGIWPTAWSGTHDVPYEAIPGADVDGSGTPAAALTRRFVSQGRIFYRSDDLTSTLALGVLQPQAIPADSYTASLTPGLLSAIFGTLVPPATLTEGAYLQLPGETGWWLPSGQVFYSPGDTDTPAQELANALTQFFLPRRAVDPFGAISRVSYDAYNLLPVTTTDPVNNVISVGNDYRVLQPTSITDPNGNTSAVAFDALGLVTATALMGKTGQNVGDTLTGYVTDLDDPMIAAQFADPISGAAVLLGNATTRIIRDLGAYQRTSGAAQPSPVAVYTLARETHVSDLATAGPGGTPTTTLYQFLFAYCDGLGRDIQRKVRVAPGAVTDGGPVLPTRWTGSGWTIFNNKGDPVRRYEPFFSSTNLFEFAAQIGVSTVMLYDPLHRVVATLHPDNTWEKVVFDEWMHETWDSNDTVLIADPRTDADVGNYFERCLGTGPFTSWYNLRIGGTYGATADAQAAQQDAAQKAAAHAATPAFSHFDALGRTCLAVDNNGGGNRYASRTAYDAQGKPLAVFDAFGRRLEENCFRSALGGGGFQYLAGMDMAGNQLYRVSAEAGARRALNNVAKNPIRAWDARGHAFRLVYDAAQRPTRRFVSSGGAAEILIELTIYGEGQAPANLCGRVFRHYDMTGYLENTQYDFKGNLLSSTRQLAADYHQAIDWTPLAALTSGAALDAAAVGAGLIPSGDGGRDRFVGNTVYDALNRQIQAVAPHNATMRPDVIRPAYDEGAMLVQVDVWLQEATPPTTLLDPATADRLAVSSIEYNARGQRLSLSFGNGVETLYTYDPLTFRLTNLTTNRPTSFAADEQTVQEFAYYYDPVANITRIRDYADTQDVIFFRNQRVEPSSDYTYDPLYRLIASAGREHLGQNAGALLPPQQVSSDDSFRAGLPQPGDGNAMGLYTESYTYDPVGNLQKLAHNVSSGNWTQNYTYSEASQIVAGETSNRLSTTSLPGDPAGGPYSAVYQYDPHGSMVRMPHLPVLAWDEDDRLRSTTRQVVTSGAPETSFYAYDAGGNRIRKATDSQAAAGQNPRREFERIYLGAIELYREYAADGTTITLERETLHVDAGPHPIAFIETRTTGTDPAPQQLVRYQYGNHLGSAVLELGDQADIISYEEYFPFGSTSYQAVESQTDTPKRYRYSDRERDTENDLYYHGARYGAPWLGRWVSADPIGLRGGANLYAFAADNPVKLVDRTGMQPTAAANDISDLLTFMHSQAGFEAGKALPPTFNWRSASPFGTAAHGKLKGVAKALQDAKFKGAERIYTDVRVEGGVVTGIGVSPGGPKGAHNLDVLVTKEGQTLSKGQSISGGYAERITDFKYGRGTIDPKYAVHGSPLETVKASKLTPGAEVVVEAEKTAGTASKVAEAGEVSELVSKGTKVTEAIETVGKVSKAEKVLAAGSRVLKTAAPVIKVLKPLAPVVKVVGKVAGPLGIATSALELATAKGTEQKVDAGIGLVANTLLATDNPIAMAGGGGLLAGQYIEKKLNVSEYSSQHGIDTQEFLKAHGVGETGSFVAGAIVTVGSTPIAIGEAAVAKLKSLF
jgi:RHS repeat-associated protein